MIVICIIVLFWKLSLFVEGFCMLGKVCLVWFGMGLFRVWVDILFEIVFELEGIGDVLKCILWWILGLLKIRRKELKI